MQVGALLMGRNTYDVVHAMGPDMWCVFHACACNTLSRTLSPNHMFQRSHTRKHVCTRDFMTLVGIFAHDLSQGIRGDASAGSNFTNSRALAIFGKSHQRRYQVLHRAS